MPLCDCLSSVLKGCLFLGWFSGHSQTGYYCSLEQMSRPARCRLWVEYLGRPLLQSLCTTTAITVHVLSKAHIELGTMKEKDSVSFRKTCLDTLKTLVCFYTAQSKCISKEQYHWKQKRTERGSSVVCWAVQTSFLALCPWTTCWTAEYVNKQIIELKPRLRFQPCSCYH